MEYKQPEIPTAEYPQQAYPAICTNGNDKVKDVDLPTGEHSYRLVDLACTRSGDKGNNCNIGQSLVIPHINLSLANSNTDKYKTLIIRRGKIT